MHPIRRIRQFHFGAFMTTALVLAAIPAHATLIITPTFDSSITSDPNAAGIENTVDAAIAVFESTYSNPIDVQIYFQETTSGLGGSNFYYYEESYRTFYNDLVANDANPAAIAGLNANGGDADTNGGINPVTGTPYIDIKSANARALGINIPPGCVPIGTAGNMQCSSDPGTAYDGIISLNTDITYPPQANNGNNYGLMSVVEHEIDEIIGLGSSLPNTSASSGTVNFLAGNPAPEDLFRYTAPGEFAGPTNCASPAPAYLSYTGATALTYFNNGCNGGDFGDWAGAGYPQVQDAFATAGANPSYGANEIAAETAIGYDLASTPEPGTWLLLSLALPALFFVRKRRA